MQTGPASHTRDTKATAKSRREPTRAKPSGPHRCARTDNDEVMPRRPPRSPTSGEAVAGCPSYPIGTCGRSVNPRIAGKRPQITNMRLPRFLDRNRLISRDSSPQAASACLTENRGVPGSSPGLAICWTESRIAVGFLVCRCDDARAREFMSPLGCISTRTITGKPCKPRCRRVGCALGLRNPDTVVSNCAS